MKKKGQVKIIFATLLALITLLVIFLTIRYVYDLDEQKHEADLINFELSLQTRILQQQSASVGSVRNITLSVPSSVDEVCFFDSTRESIYINKPELISLFSDDLNHQAFLRTSDGYLPMAVEGISFSDNPSCVGVLANTISLSLVSRQNSVFVDIPANQRNDGCIEVIGNGDPNNKIDIVFLPYGFSSDEDFAKEVDRYTSDILFEFPPFDAYEHTFNIYRLNTDEIECSIDSFIRCDNYQLRRVAARCPHDQIVLLVDRSQAADMINPVRSSAIGDLMKLNTADRPFVIVHEFGHSFGGLADEYVDNQYYQESTFDVSSFPNCDISPCTAWEGVDETSCFEGCSLDRFFRPTRTSIMRSLSSDTFGPVNEQELRKRLLYYE